MDGKTFVVRGEARLNNLFKGRNTENVGTLASADGREDARCEKAEPLLVDMDPGCLRGWICNCSIRAV